MICASSKYLHYTHKELLLAAQMSHQILFVCLFFLPFLSSAKLEGVHNEFQKTVKAGSCRYDADRGVLVLLSRSDMAQKRASMMQEMYFRNLTQKVGIFFRF